MKYAKPSNEQSDEVIREEIGEMTPYKKQKKNGLAAIVALIFLASLLLPGVALAVNRSGGNSAFFGRSSFAGQQARPHGFHHRGFFGDDETGGVGVTVEQSSPARTEEPEKPTKTRRYV